MVTAKARAVLTRNIRWLVVGVLLVSTVLYVSGVVIERSSENREVPAAQQGAGDVKESQNETGETHTDVSPATPSEPRRQESLLGINLESPWLVVAVVLVTLILAGALMRFGRPALFLIVIFSLAAMLLDILEIVTQVNRSNTGMVVVAFIVALAHVVLGAVSIVALSRNQAWVSSISHARL